MGGRDITVRPTARGWRASFDDRSFPCAIGRGGVTAAKREGDGATPLGRFALRCLLYRADRGLVPRCGLETTAILPDLGWCDWSGDAAYNRPVTLPWASSAERLWRDDDLYDYLVPLGYNDRVPRPGAGSAIFLHVARPGLTATEGCVALRRSDLLALLPALGQDCCLTVRAD
ncbi:MAG: L,D-transpeptidase family protein [Rhodospirillales bacterium]